MFTLLCLAVMIVMIVMLVRERLLIRSIHKEEEAKMIEEGLIQLPPKRKWWRWDHGRQNSGYSKFLIASSRLLKFDCYILKFPNGVGIPEHTDPAIEGYEHHRLNIFLNSPCIGTGIVTIKGSYKQWMHDRIQLFRPDLYAHSMTPVEFIWSKDSLYILSIGWLKRKS